MKVVERGRYVGLNYESLTIEGDAGNVTIAVRDRSEQLFFDPNVFPITVNGTDVTIDISWGDESEWLTVKRVGADAGEMINLYDATDYQKTIALLYLIKQVVPEWE